MNVGKNLKRIRKDKGISQVDLAKSSGVSQQLISQIERGENVTTNRLPEIAKVLGCQVWEIDPKFTPGAAPVTGWMALLENAVRTAFAQGAGPVDIRVAIEQIVPLRGTSDGLGPSMTEEQEQLLRDLSETSAARQGKLKNQNI